VFVLINQLSLSVRSIFVLNIGLAAAWIILGFVVVRQHRVLSEAAATQENNTNAPAKEPSGKAS